jgi:hypothetical protein
MEEIQILISSFKGFSKHTGKSKLTDKLLEIGSYTNGRIIEKIRALVRDGKKEEAALVKKQLKGSTLSATYKERRVPEMIDTYNDLQMMDLDGLSEEEMTNCRKLITGSPNTLFCFTSPSGNGLKVGVYMQDELSCRLRMELLRRSEISYEALETYHKQMFAYAKEYYETLCRGGCQWQRHRQIVFHLLRSGHLHLRRGAQASAATATDHPPAPSERKEKDRTPAHEGGDARR